MASPQITPSELANLIGLSPGIDGPAATIKPFAEWQALCDSAKFASIYLPSLHRTLLAGFKSAAYRPRSIDSDSGWDSFFRLFPFLSWIDLVGDTPIWIRFVRERPSEVREMFWSLLLSLTRIPLEVMEVVQIRDKLVQPFTMFLVKHIVVVFAAYPQLDKADLPSFSDEEKKELSLRLPLLTPIDAYPGSSLAQGNLWKAIQKLPQKNWDLVAWASGFDSPNWGRCSLLLAQPSAQHLCGKKSELMACSRCLASHYCSKEHQALDWEHHKRTCVRAGW